jgi:hypothetical protein
MGASKGIVIPKIEFPNQKVNFKTSCFLSVKFVVWSISYFTTYIYVGNFMKESLGFTSEQVINQNLKVSI